MELCHCGSLSDFVARGILLNENELRDVTCCCLFALSHVHNNNIIHRVGANADG